MRSYLDESTEPKITRVAERELISAQARGQRPCGSGGTRASVPVFALAARGGGGRGKADDAWKGVVEHGARL